MKENKCKSPNLVNAAGSETSSNLSGKADPFNEHPADELRPLKSNVSDHKIKSIKSSSRRDDSEKLYRPDELGQPVKPNDKEFETAILSELVTEETATSIVDLVPRPSELDEQSEASELDNAGEGTRANDDTGSGKFYQAIRKMIRTGGGLNKLKKKHEYLSYLEAIKNYDETDASLAPQTTKDAEGKTEISSEFVKVKAKIDNQTEADSTPFGQNGLQVDYDDSSTSISASCSVSSLNSDQLNLFKDPTDGPNAPAAKESPEKAKKTKEKVEDADPVSLFDSKAMTVALYGTAGTILSAALYYLLNK